MVKEVQSNEPVGTTGRFCKGVHGQRGGVGGKDGLVSASLVQRIENSGLDVKIFEHGFDDQIGVLCRVFHADHARDSTLDGVDLSG